MHGPVLDPVDDAGRQLAAVLGHLVDRLLALQVPDVPHHGLLGGLGRHPGEVVRGQLGQHLAAFRVAAAAGDRHRSGAGIDVHGHVPGRVEGVPVSVGERLLDGPDQLLQRDAKLGVELFQGRHGLGIQSDTVNLAASTSSQGISSSPVLGLSTVIPGSPTAASTPSTTPSLFSP